jgi:hypothetical protein
MSTMDSGDSPIDGSAAGLTSTSGSLTLGAADGLLIFAAAFFAGAALLGFATRGLVERFAATGSAGETGTPGSADDVPGRGVSDAVAGSSVFVDRRLLVVGRSVDLRNMGFFSSGI